MYYLSGAKFDKLRLGRPIGAVPKKSKRPKPYKKIKEIVNKKPSKVLRVTLSAEDWKGKKVLEWTDTTQTVVRYRVTRSMTTQAAATGNDGKVYLHGVHLAKDRRSDGT